MSTAHLVLQYPDWQSGRTRLLAMTNDKRALAVFKQAVLEEARVTLLRCDDDILRIEYREELNKLSFYTIRRIAQKSRSFNWMLLLSRNHITCSLCLSPVH
jgi:hypothetical protein